MVREIIVEGKLRKPSFKFLFSQHIFDSVYTWWGLQQDTVVLLTILGSVFLIICYFIFNWDLLVVRGIIVEG